MFEFFTGLFETAGFPPRWRCGTWTDAHGWLHIVSDVAVFGAYAAIPIVLAYFVSRRKDVPFAKVFWLFFAFIFLCGITHLIEATIFWKPWYRLSGLFKLLTAIASWGTVFALARVMPRALRFPELLRTNDRLTEEISVRAATEEGLRRSHEQLESKVQERTHDLQEATRLATRASQVKSEFLSNMSHELRTPLNGILGMAEILDITTSLDKEQSSSVATIRRSALSLLGLIDDILDFSAIEDGRIRLRRAPFSLRNTLEELALAVASSAEAKGIETVCDIDQRVPSVVLGDESRIRQVLQSLASNAVKFSSDGEIVLAAEVLGQDEQAVSIRLSVTDSGRGISPEEAESIFDRFYRGGGAGGTGLGLTIAKRIAEEMKGALTVESQPGQGSSFRFDVSLGRAVDESFHSGVLSLQGERVLIVDDNDLSRETLSWHLQSWRASPIQARSCGEAEMLVGDPTGGISLVVLDVDLPDGRGMETVRRIRAAATGRQPEFILLAAPERVPEASEQVALGISSTLSKPAREAQLFHAVFTAVKSRRETATVSASPPRRDGPPRILVAEDHPDNRKVASVFLRHFGYEAEFAVDGQEAIKMYLENSYDLVLLDLGLPRIHGIEVAREIRRREAGLGFRCPIVALTAHVLPSDREQCFAVGMDDFVSKPIQGERLRSVLARLIPREGESPELQPTSERGASR